MWFSFGKPSEFYSSNPVFIVKLILFGVVGSLSVLPTVYFIKNRKGDPSELVKSPGWLKPVILVELITLFVIPLLAVLMAAGIRF
jgi:putative membrane protein